MLEALDTEDIEEEYVCPNRGAGCHLKDEVYPVIRALLECKSKVDSKLRCPAASCQSEKVKGQKVGILLVLTEKCKTGNAASKEQTKVRLRLFCRKTMRRPAMYSRIIIFIANALPTRR